MQDDSESIVQKPREPFSDIILRQNADELARFMDQPLTAIAEAVTGALAAGPQAWTVMTGHIVQGILKGKLFEQVGREIKELRDKGKIPDDFAEKKYGFQSWVELLKTIDDETPDADKLDALKAMFYSVNKIGNTDGERILNYQLFQIAKQLSSHQLLILKAVNEAQSAQEFGRQNQYGRIPWAETVATRLGHKLSHLVSKEEAALVGQGFIEGRHPGDEGASRLTPLGALFCENIRTYHIEAKASGGDK